MTCPHSSSRSERLAARLLRRPGLEKIAVRALRRATHLLGLAIGTRLARMRDSDLSHNRLGAKIEEQVLLTSFFPKQTGSWPSVGKRFRTDGGPTTRPNFAIASCV